MACDKMAGFPHGRIRRAFALGDADATALGKGYALESIVRDFFCAVPGVEILEQNAMDADGSIEVDVLVYIASGSPIQFLSEFVVIEAKNWAVPVGSQVVSGFVNKIQSMGLTTGILVATSGVTGNAESRSRARAVIARAYDQHKIRLVVLDRADIEAVRSSQDITQMMRRAWGRLIMRNPLS